MRQRIQHHGAHPVRQGETGRDFAVSQAINRRVQRDHQCLRSAGNGAGDQRHRAVMIGLHIKLKPLKRHGCDHDRMRGRFPQYRDARMPAAAIAQQLRQQANPAKGGTVLI